MEILFAPILQYFLEKDFYNWLKMELKPVFRKGFLFLLFSFPMHFVSLVEIRR